MSPTEVPPIGERIRAERVRKGVTVRGLAAEIGVSASLISQVETDKSNPSVSTLYAITTALGISIEDLFAAPEEAVADTAGTLAATPRAVSADDIGLGAGPLAAPPADPAAGGPRVLESDGSRRVGPVVGPAEREALSLESGVRWELLGKVPGAHVEFLRVTYEPGGASSSAGALMRHSGTEYGYLISGELVLTLGFDEHRLSPGDAISFESSTPHAYRNEGAEPAVGVWFVLERSS